ncbi:MAG: hypothetical protein OHK0046_49980 [Anaerolineae bacterium]
MSARIMVVDDEWLIRELMENVLRLNGYEVMLAHNGEQALKMAQDTPPDLILLDLRMPGMDGYDVAREIKNNPVTQQAIVVMMSGVQGTAAERAEAEDAGADDFLSRSLPTQALVARLAALLEARQNP